MFCLTLSLRVPQLLLYVVATLALASCEATTPVGPVPVQVVSQLKPAPRLEVAVDIRPHSMWTPARIDKAREGITTLEEVLKVAPPPT